MTVKDVASCVTIISVSSVSAARWRRTMQSVISRLDDSVMRMIEGSVDESSKSRLYEGDEGIAENGVDIDKESSEAAVVKHGSEKEEKK